MKEKFLKLFNKNYNVPILVATLVLDVLLLIGSLAAYVFLSRDYSIKYSENGEVSTSVALKDNEFFKDDYEETSNEYIASLIDYIDATFKYDFGTSDDNVNVDGDYEIIANIDVLDKSTHNTIYNYKDTLVEKTTLDLKNDFDRTIRVDYAMYNNLIKRFIDIYDLDGTENTLTVTMYVHIRTGTELNVKDTEKVAEIRFSVPLTEKTVAVSIDKNDYQNSDFLRVQQTGNKTPLLIFALIFLVIAIFGLFDISRRIKNSRTPIQNFHRELEKISKTYASFLQPVKEPYKVGKMQLIEVETLEDLFEIRDSLQAPVLMCERRRPLRAEFVIPAMENNTVYKFVFKVSDVE